MKKGKDYSKYFARGQELETSLSSSSLFSRDSGLHLMSYKIKISGKTTIIDNISVYGSTILILESKNYTVLQGTYEDSFWRGRGRGRYFSILSPIKQNEYHASLMSQYLVSKGLKTRDFKIEHYIVVPDKCKVEVDEKGKLNVLHRSELERLKSKLAYYNPKLNKEVAKCIKEGLL